MNTETFFQQFELFADAPNGIAKLRELILQLAVQGKLVPQNPDDEPAAVLLERIKAEKERLVKEGKIKKSKKLPDIKQDEIPFELPNSWQWTRLLEIGQINPRNNCEDNLEVSFVPMNLVPQAYGETIEFEIRKWSDIKKGYTHFADNDVVFAKITPCFQNGKAAVVEGLSNGLGAGTTELYVFRGISNFICPKYVFLYLKSPKFVNYGVSQLTGTAGQKRVPKDYFSKNPFPLPPFAEQHRIVEKVDRLMELCDRLETQKQQQQTKTLQLGTVATSRLTAAKTPEAFKQHWQNISNNFDLIYSTPENIKQLRQTILQLAVMGKLVPQNPDDEPASVLLAKIKAEKEKLIKEGKIKKSKKLKAIASNEIPYELPRGWKWSRFPELGEIGRGKSKHRPRNDPSLYDGGKYPLIQTGDVARANGVIHTYKALYNDKGLAQSRLWKKETLCITIAANIADSALLGFDACFPDSVVGFIPSKEIKKVTYFEYFMRTAKERLQDFAPSTAQKNINLAILEQVLIPLPPLAEQHRIVAKVNQLMTYCDKLEAKLTQSLSDKEKLMDTAVYQLLTV